MAAVFVFFEGAQVVPNLNKGGRIERGTIHGRAAGERKRPCLKGGAELFEAHQHLGRNSTVGTH
eukprot:7338007-Pyramimonas_sp.AAC.1